MELCFVKARLVNELLQIPYYTTYELPLNAFALGAFVLCHGCINWTRILPSIQLLAARQSGGRHSI